MPYMITYTGPDREESFICEMAAYPDASLSEISQRLCLHVEPCSVMAQIKIVL